MTRASSLSAPLTIKDSQSGFAGETATVWTIMPDWTYMISRQVGLQTLDPERQGRLNPDQQVRLKEMLDRAVAAGQPKQPAGTTPVNARRISVSYDQTQSMLTLPAGGGDLGALRAVARNDAAGALMELAEQVRRMTSG